MDIVIILHYSDSFECHYYFPNAVSLLLEKKVPCANFMPIKVCFLPKSYLAGSSQSCLFEQTIDGHDP